MLFKIFRSLGLAIVMISVSMQVTAQSLNIKNDVFRKDKEGLPIFSQGGGIFKFPDPVSGLVKYYWYGVHYKEADLYFNNPSITQQNATFESVTCYSSNDLVNWTFEGNVLTRDEAARSGTRPWVGRLGVAYIPALKSCCQLADGIIHMAPEDQYEKYDRDEQHR
jgi:hypothetical protein